MSWCDRQRGACGAGSASTSSPAVSTEVHGAAELNYADVGVIRFYPEGGASGGGIDLRRRDGSGTAVNVDWLVGRVSLAPLRDG